MGKITERQSEQISIWIAGIYLRGQVDGKMNAKCTPEFLNFASQELVEILEIDSMDQDIVPVNPIPDPNTPLANRRY